MSTATEARPTPGPWTVEDECDIYGCGELLASAYAMKRDGLLDSWKGNANLIAAAPDMLEALETLMKILDGVLLPAAVEGYARAAIRKARGGQ